MIDTTKFIEILPGIWYEIETGLPWTSKYKEGSAVWYDGPLYRFNKGKERYYTITLKNRKTIKWHRLVYEYFHKVKIPKNKWVDHIDNDYENNKINNLQLLTPRKNSRKKSIQSNNTSGYPGVSKHLKNRNWTADIKYRNKHIHIGSYDTPEEAYKAYIEAKIKYHGIESIKPLYEGKII